MLDVLATTVLRLADRIHTRLGGPDDEAEFSAVVDGRSVGYDIIRDDRTPSTPATLVVGIHGFGADERQLRSLVPLDSIDAPILYVAVRGSWTVTGGGYAWFPIGDDAQGGFDVDMADLDVAVGELHAFVSVASTWPDVSSDRCWLIGYSQGAPLALHATAARPDLIAGCAAGSGALLTPLEPDTDLSDVAVMVAASTIDPFVTPDQTDDLQRQLTDAGAHVDTVIDAAPHVITTTQATAIAAWLDQHLPTSPTPQTAPHCGIRIQRESISDLPRGDRRGNAEVQGGPP